MFGPTIAAVALLNDLMANPAVVGAAFFTHKRTLHTLFDGCTNHWNHLLINFFKSYYLNWVKKKAGMHFNPAITVSKKLAEYN